MVYPETLTAQENQCSHTNTHTHTALCSTFRDACGKPERCALTRRSCVCGERSLLKPRVCALGGLPPAPPQPPIWVKRAHVQRRICARLVRKTKAAGVALHKRVGLWRYFARERASLIVSIVSIAESRPDVCVWSQRFYEVLRFG